MNAMTGSFGDPTSMADLPEVSTNRCSDYDLSGFAKAMNCGSPLSLPCFDFSRCRNGPTVYIYDQEVSLGLPLRPRNKSFIQHNLWTPA